MSAIGWHTIRGSGPRVSIVWMSICAKCKKRRNGMAMGKIVPKDGHELVLTRVFDAPRELVFKAWTDPKCVAEWWGPNGFTNPVCELDVRPGGAIRIHMRGPDAIVYPMTGVYQEVVWPERLVFTSAALDLDGNPMFEVRTTVTFAETGGKTEQSLRAPLIKETAPHP